VVVAGTLSPEQSCADQTGLVGAGRALRLLLVEQGAIRRARFPERAMVLRPFGYARKSFRGWLVNLLRLGRASLARVE
jgi:hypothetical protein